jgi:hypothetical protein
MEKLIQEYLKNRAKGEMLRTKDCLSERDLADYLEVKLPPERRDKIEAHLAGCFFCQDLLVSTKEILNKHAVKIHPWRNAISKNKWFWSSLAVFIFSFIFPRYFLQFLLAAFLLGLKWVFSGEGTRNMVMIIRTLRGQESVPIEKK